MSLYLVATPIGNVNDISLRGLEILKTAEVIIVEERKEGAAFLRAHGITGKTYEQLNEHSTKEDLVRLLEICKTKVVALITDCGTPGFADPGGNLVRVCRDNKIEIHSLPGPSSLMTLLSLCGQRIDSFLYRGFLSPETETRRKEWMELAKNLNCIILMDTPYRLLKTMSDLSEHFSQRKILVGIDLTQETEKIFEGTAKSVAQQITIKKAEFIVLIYPTSH